MKLLLLLMVVFSSTNILALDQVSVTCFDKRKVLVQPCSDLETSLFFYQGLCERDHEFQYSYCANEEMTELIQSIGKVEVRGLVVGGYVSVILHGSGRMIRVPEGYLGIRNCMSAITLIGKSKKRVEEANSSEGYVPEIGISSLLLKFQCND